MIILSPNLLFSGLFTTLVCLAIVTDVRHLLISNRVSFSLIISFFVYALVLHPGLPLGEHVLVAFCAFALGFPLFVLRWFAGGDIKLVTALSLWAGTDLILPFALLTAWFGILLSVGVLLVKWLDTYGEMLGMPSDARRFLPRWARKGLCPYGLAIGVAALIVMPPRFF